MLVVQLMRHSARRAQGDGEDGGWVAHTGLAQGLGALSRE